MYAFTIIETSSAVEARITRVVLESAGYPTIAATWRAPDVDDEHIAITAAPEGEPARFERAIKMYAKLGERGVEYAIQVANSPEVQLITNTNPRAVPTSMRNAVRNSLLHTLYTAAAEEHVTVVTSEPNYSKLATNHDPGDENRAEVNNPAGGGFDGECRGAEQWRNHFSA